MVREGQGRVTLTNMHESHPHISDLRLPDLKPQVQSYIAGLKKNLFVIYAKYEVKNRNELAVKVREGKVDTKNSDKVIELLKLINESGRKDEVVIIERIIRDEGRKLEIIFGRKIEIPPLPKEIPPERIQEWREKKLELHYLPPIDMAQESELKNWIRPNFSFITIGTETGLPADAMKLPGCWTLVDTRERPQKESDDQVHGDDEDFLGPVLENLRDRNLIVNFKHPQSRFNISFDELEKPEVITAMAAACGLKPEQISTPRMVEFYFLQSFHYPGWRNWQSASDEHFSDKKMSGRLCLLGGKADFKDHAWVFANGLNDRKTTCWFRIIGRFK